MFAEKSNLLSSLEFLINERKSVFSPSTSCLYLGFIFDSIYFSVAILPEKKEKLLKLTLSFLDKKSCTIREFASFIGSLISMPSSPIWDFAYQDFERVKFHALLNAKENFDASFFH